MTKTAKTAISWVLVGIYVYTLFATEQVHWGGFAFIAFYVLWLFIPTTVPVMTKASMQERMLNKINTAAGIQGNQPPAEEEK